jgi:hypothetical protein
LLDYSGRAPRTTHTFFIFIKRHKIAGRSKDEAAPRTMRQVLPCAKSKYARARSVMAQLIVGSLSEPARNLILVVRNKLQKSVFQGSQQVPFASSVGNISVVHRTS